MTGTAESAVDDEEATTVSGGRQSVVSGIGGSSAGAATAGAQGKAAGGELPTAVEFEPPFACVRRILKTALPASTNVGKDASAAFARASGAYFNRITLLDRIAPKLNDGLVCFIFARGFCHFLILIFPECCSKSVAGIFIIYLTACANDFARENKRQTITANDVLAAVKVTHRTKREVVNTPTRPANTVPQ
jgi:histone H3/H4